MKRALVVAPTVAEADAWKWRGVDSVLAGFGVVDVASPRATDRIARGRSYDAVYLVRVEAWPAGAEARVLSIAYPCLAVSGGPLLVVVG